MMTVLPGELAHARLPRDALVFPDERRTTGERQGAKRAHGCFAAELGLGSGASAPRSPACRNLPIVALYAGLNGLILLWLAAAVSRIRLRTGIWLGDGGAPELVRAMRGLANFAEYVPLMPAAACC